jgi:hypothetical protein
MAGRVRGVLMALLGLATAGREDAIFKDAVGLGCFRS